MDVCKPDLEYIDGICYRINPSTCSIPSSTGNNVIYNEDDDDCSINTATPQYLDENEADFLNDIEEVEGGRYKTSFHVPCAFFSYIVGSKGVKARRIEAETKAKINIPRLGQRDGGVVITGPDKYSVARARKRVKGIVFVQRSKSSYTHFISIPLNDESFIQGFLKFKKRVLETNNDQRIDESLFQNEHKLHLTIWMLLLCDNVERNSAIKVFKECKELFISPLLSGKNLLLDMTGVDCMNDDPSSVVILYAKVSFPEYPNLLQELSDGIVSFFADRGIDGEKRSEKVKLHATVMNTQFRSSNENDNNKKREDTFDATSILKEFENYHFGKAVINQIDLSVRFTTSKETLYYQATSTITLP